MPSPEDFFQLPEDDQMHLYWFNVINEEMQVKERIEELEAMSGVSSKPVMPRRQARRGRRNG